MTIFAVAASTLTRLNCLVSGLPTKILDVQTAEMLALLCGTLVRLKAHVYFLYV